MLWYTIYTSEIERKKEETGGGAVRCTVLIIITGVS